ncbi:hypothetical protein M7I_3695 [Glarea lozoyensis 74030]|uniref:Uncharacterized protein n=1 Tax=Glarea lozoyensis (strain ATCC 74030 / MF5533) TaxID=1104152 RepID=H0EM67_GLAL7|nr:hypothetical protein M7I_3695 [Glarea lozoyensis 74030]
MFLIHAVQYLQRPIIEPSLIPRGIPELNHVVRDISI